MSPTFELSVGESPLLVSVPHAGTSVPDDVFHQFVPSARSLPDTDWFVDRLYDWVPELGGTLLVATHSRYVIDVNRPPDNVALYDTPTTGLVPRVQFDGSPIYGNSSPGDIEIAARKRQFYQPYHDQLRDELSRIKSIYGFAILFDAHSIKSRVPRLFDGRLPDLNLGTFSGRSADSQLIEIATRHLRDAGHYAHVVDGRFRGGYITRQYGQPERGVHALQLELAQTTYMDEDRVRYDDAGADKLQRLLRQLLSALLHWQP